MPEEIDPFAINEQTDIEVESLPQDDTPEVVDNTQDSLDLNQDDILDSIHSVPNPVQEPPVEKESILSRVTPRGRKKRKTPPPVDGVTPYDSTEPNTALPDLNTENGVAADKLDTMPVAEESLSIANEQQFEDIPNTVENQYQEPTYPQNEYQQPQYQYQNDQQQASGYTNPLLTNQPLPVNYTAPNVYDPYNPYATMVDINQDLPAAPKKTDWRFVITLGIAIICLIGLIFFWIMWFSATSTIQDATYQIQELTTKADTGQKAANQLTDLQTTVRELNTKIEDLQEENDDLKKNEDKIKDLEKEKTTLEEKVKTLQNENATLSKDVDYWKDKAK